MASPRSTHILIVGAGAAGLMAARVLSRAGKQVTVIEARERCGGRIWTLPAEEFGYPAEGGPEFVHGAAPVTRAVMREASLSLQRRGGSRWSKRSGTLTPDDAPMPYARQFYEALIAVKADLPVAEFLEAHFSDPPFEGLRRSVTRTVEGYDAADPQRMSTFALRDEWMARDDGEHGRIAGGYGGLIDHLAADSRRHGAAIHFGAVVEAAEETSGGIAVRCRDGARFEADAAILTVPLPLLSKIALPAATHDTARAIADIGYGNVVKLLLRFETPWWASPNGRDLSDLSFLISNAAVPTWWTQQPLAHPVLTGWYAGPKADRVLALSEDELVEMGIVSLAEIFELPTKRIRGALVAARAINWGNDPFARGAYSYATPQTRAALQVMKTPGSIPIFFSGEALYEGPDMGTVEAALASGQETAQALLARP